MTADKQSIGSATGTAERIRRDILEQTQLTASAGISYNKFIAKIASDQNKPDGICVIRPHEGAPFVATLPVRRFYGVGPRTAERMARMGIHTGADLCAQDIDYLQTHFGKSAQYLYNASRGIDNRLVKPNRVRKSVGRERTFGEDLLSNDALRSALADVLDSVWQRIEANSAIGRTVTLKVKFADFQQITRSQSVYEPVADRTQFDALAYQLLEQVMPVEQGVRLLGVTLSSLLHDEQEAAADQVKEKEAEESGAEAGVERFVQAAFDF